MLLEKKMLNAERYYLLVIAGKKLKEYYTCL